jgi:leader peptidase (prepilin peptidase)/N-methyltransferase
VSTEDLLVALAAAGAAAVLALCAPRLVAALPEPEPPDELEPAEEPDPESQAEPPIEPEPAKQLYAELGATRGLGLRLAAAAAVGAGEAHPAGGAHAVVAVWVYVCALGVLLAYIDWHTRLLPFLLVAPSYGVVAALVAAAAVVERDVDLLVRAGVGWLASFGIFLLMWTVYRKGIGYGDVRLSGVLGMALAAVGWQELVVGMYAAFLFGALGGGLLTLARKVDRRAYPFGPFMVLGAWFGALSGPWLAGWYP